MYYWRKIKQCFLTVGCVFFLFVDSYGHGGGVDSKGGHYNKKTGEYHYHKKKPVSSSSSKLNLTHKRFWLNTKTKTIHNSKCRYFGKSKSGYFSDTIPVGKKYKYCKLCFKTTMVFPEVSPGETTILPENSIPPKLPKKADEEAGGLIKNEDEEKEEELAPSLDYSLDVEVVEIVDEDFPDDVDLALTKKNTLNESSSPKKGILNGETQAGLQGRIKIIKISKKHRSELRQLWCYVKCEANNKRFFAIIEFTHLEEDRYAKLQEDVGIFNSSFRKVLCIGTYKRKTGSLMPIYSIYPKSNNQYK